MIAAVVFDLDGLMADSEPLAEWAWNQLLARYGQRLDAETRREILGLRVIESAGVVCRRLDLPLTPQEAAAERERLFLDAITARLRPCAGLYPLLDELAARGLPLAVATSARREYALAEMEMLHIAHRFRALAAGDEVERGKPAPDVYLLAAARLGVDPARCLALDDAPLGVAAARAAGMTAVMVAKRQQNSDTQRAFASLDEVRLALNDLLAIEEES